LNEYAIAAKIGFIAEIYPMGIPDIL